MAAVAFALCSPESERERKKLEHSLGIPGSSLLDLEIRNLTHIQVTASLPSKTLTYLKTNTLTPKHGQLVLAQATPFLAIKY